MITWKQAVREGVVTGSLASVLSGAYLALAGYRRDEPAAPLNAISHWFFGNRPLRDGEPDLVYTVAGYVTHHMASIFWATLHAKFWGARPEKKRPLPAAAGAIAAASLASFVDYQCTPKRLTPGFEHRLGKPEMVNVYACFALGLAIGSMLMKRR